MTDNTRTRDIVIGKATVPYCGNGIIEGHKWALPGRKTTDNLEHAVQVAQIISEIIDKEEGTK